MFFEEFLHIRHPNICHILKLSAIHAIISSKVCGLHASSPCFSCRSVDIKREIARYRAGLASAPIAGFMVMYNKHSLSLDDLGTLEEQNWINDQVKRAEEVRQPQTKLFH